MNDPQRIYNIVKKNKLVTGINEYELPETPPEVERVIPQELIDYWKKVNNPGKPDEIATLVYSMEELIEVIKNRGQEYLNRFIGSQEPQEFVLDEHNTPAVQTLIYYFCSSNDFNLINDKYSLKKSILLRSSKKGTGKTILMKLFAHSEIWKDKVRFNSYNILKVQPCRKVVSEYRKFGESIYDKYCEMISDKKILNTWVFDELGREDLTVNSYGNKTNVMEKIMADRYDLFIDHGVKTHLTTNITDKKDIETRYGDYITSRMREMYNIIDLQGEDRRR
jgi:hypothetical protein